MRIALEREDGAISSFELYSPPPGSSETKQFLPCLERIVKFLLWQKGGFRITVGGPKEYAAYLSDIYSDSGARKFDADFMARIYQHPFEVLSSTYDSAPLSDESSVQMGGNNDGCRVGIDLGGSSRTACAMQDGKVIFTETLHWNPTPESDPQYHISALKESIRRAAAHLPRLDAVGISSAGVYIGNRVRIGSIYRGVSIEDFTAHITDMYPDLSKELGVPVLVANDGEVTALSGTISDNLYPVLGLALGSALGGGYVNREGKIPGWLDELEFVPLDMAENAPCAEWSGDKGTSVDYLSQQAAVRLGEILGIPLDPTLPMGARFRSIQNLMDTGDSKAMMIFMEMGRFLAGAVRCYDLFYDLDNIILMGGVIGGTGGEVMLATAKQTLKIDEPKLLDRINLLLPSEEMRKTGQAMAAATLPKIRRS